jgi:hypothetical protein
MTIMQNMRMEGERALKRTGRAQCGEGGQKVERRDGGT